jgi:hypothetical protein
MGAFNEWAKGSFLEQPANRNLPAVANSLMRGAAALKRAEIARMQGIHAAQANPRPVTPYAMRQLEGVPT